MIAMRNNDVAVIQNLKYRNRFKWLGVLFMVIAAICITNIQIANVCLELLDKVQKDYVIQDQDAFNGLIDHIEASRTINIIFMCVSFILSIWYLMYCGCCDCCKRLTGDYLIAQPAYIQA